MSTAFTPQVSSACFLKLTGRGGLAMTGFYWDGDPNERVFMEITDRTDIGTDLKAPLLGRGGVTGSYVLVPEVKAGDVVVHYDSENRQIIGASLAIGGPEPAPLLWAAKGTYARKAGVQEAWLQGIRIPLAHFNALPNPLTLDQVRAREVELMAVRDGLEKKHKKASLYYPWVKYGSGPLRTFQSYLVKMPQAAIDILPGLRTAVDAAVAARVGPIKATPEVELLEASVEAAAGRSTLRRGQGYILDQKVKVAVEVHAMQGAWDHYEALGWDIEDVHGNRSWDLECTKDGVVLRVEVKGTTTAGEEVILTPNEVKNAQEYKDVALFILADILVSRDAAGEITPSGGKPIIFDPWTIGAGTLKPIGYKYRTP